MYTIYVLIYACECFLLQTFSIQFYVPVYVQSELNFTQGEPFITYDFSGNGEWDLLTSSVSLAPLGWTPRADFIYRIERKSAFVVVNIVLPITFLSIINVLVFVLPTESGERLSFAVTLLLSLSVFMTLVGDNLPKTSDPMPILSYYLLAMLSTSTLMCVVVIFNLYAFFRKSTPPRLLVIIANAILFRKCGAGNFNQITVVDSLPEKNRLEKQISHDDDTGDSVNWVDISTALDRLSILVFVITIFCINIYYLTILSSN